jgi:hypothetical protein
MLHIDMPRTATRLNLAIRQGAGAASTVVPVDAGPVEIPLCPMYGQTIESTYSAVSVIS